MADTLRQIQAVKNRSVVVHLPDTFPPSEQVEVIILPITPGDANDSLNFFEIDTAQFTPAQLQAYERTSALIEQGRKLDEPRILGLFTGLIAVADDFDDPLPDEAIFWGETTDEDGLYLAS